MRSLTDQLQQMPDKRPFPADQRLRHIVIRDVDSRHHSRFGYRELRIAPGHV